MGIEFLKKKNGHYQRRRQVAFERLLRQGSIFDHLPRSSETRARARLLQRGTVRIGTYLWARMDDPSSQVLSLFLGGTPIAVLPSEVVQSFFDRKPDNEIVGEIVGVDDDNHRVDLRLASIKDLKQ